MRLTQANVLIAVTIFFNSVKLPNGVQGVWWMLKMLWEYEVMNSKDEVYILIKPLNKVLTLWKCSLWVSEFIVSCMLI